MRELERETGMSMERVGGLCRLIFNFRLIALTVVVLWIPSRLEDFGLLLGILGIAALTSFLPIVFWERLGSALLRHPAYLVCDLFIAMGILTLTGAESPFFYFTLGTALLAGVLYGWTGAAVLSVAILAFYWAGLYLRAEAGEVGTFQLIVGLPALYPLCAAGGAAVRNLLDRQARTEAKLAEAERSMLIERERARLAREMHDSLAKTIQGISLTASALPAWVRRDPERAASEAGQVARAAKLASAEARKLLTDMRTDMLEVPLGTAVCAFASTWSDRTGIALICDADEGCDAAPETRWELFSIVREAVRNIERHAGADNVRLGLEAIAGEIVLSVDDDGRGFEVPDDLSELRHGGHFGIIGMRERAERAGGRLEVASVPGEGMCMRVVVPQAAPPSENGRRRP
ncbi:MAG: sensor histidine kinase [Actinomycetota bacterium]|nr:sensor histidine kinase [Actinomycetota bacterium]